MCVVVFAVCVRVRVCVCVCGGNGGNGGNGDNTTAEIKASSSTKTSSNCLCVWAWIVQGGVLPTSHCLGVFATIDRAWIGPSNSAFSSCTPGRRTGVDEHSTRQTSTTSSERTSLRVRLVSWGVGWYSSFHVFHAAGPGVDQGPGGRSMLRGIWRVAWCVACRVVCGAVWLGAARHRTAWCSMA